MLIVLQALELLELFALITSLINYSYSIYRAINAHDNYRVDKRAAICVSSGAAAKSQLNI